MTRQEAKENLVELGIGEPTEDQITSFLNKVNGESKKERDRADRYKADAQKVTELTKQLEDIQNANLSDVEKANKAVEEANAKIASLEKEMARANTLKSLGEKGIIGEDAEKLIHEDGSLDFEVLGKILSERESAAATKKEQEIANGSTNPNGGSGEKTNPDDDKTDDVKMAEAISFGNVSSQNDKDFYKL